MAFADIIDECHNPRTGPLSTVSGVAPSVRAAIVPGLQVEKPCSVGSLDWSGFMLQSRGRKVVAAAPRDGRIFEAVMSKFGPQGDQRRTSLSDVLSENLIPPGFAS